MSYFGWTIKMYLELRNSIGIQHIDLKGLSIASTPGSVWELFNHLSKVGHYNILYVNYYGTNMQKGDST